jgi:hypothetical protein
MNALLGNAEGGVWLPPLRFGARRNEVVKLGTRPQAVWILSGSCLRALPAKRCMAGL